MTVLPKQFFSSFLEKEFFVFAYNGALVNVVYLGGEQSTFGDSGKYFEVSLKTYFHAVNDNL